MKCSAPSIFINVIVVDCSIRRLCI